MTMPALLAASALCVATIVTDRLGVFFHFPTATNRVENLLPSNNWDGAAIGSAYIPWGGFDRGVQKIPEYRRNTTNLMMVMDSQFDGYWEREIAGRNLANEVWPTMSQEVDTNSLFLFDFGIDKWSRFDLPVWPISHSAEYLIAPASYIEAIVTNDLYDPVLRGISNTTFRLRFKPDEWEMKRNLARSEMEYRKEVELIGGQWVTNEYPYLYKRGLLAGFGGEYLDGLVTDPYPPLPDYRTQTPEEYLGLDSWAEAMPVYGALAFDDFIYRDCDDIVTNKYPEGRRVRRIYERPFVEPWLLGNYFLTDAGTNYYDAVTSLVARIERKPVATNVTIESVIGIDPGLTSYNAYTNTFSHWTNDTYRLDWDTQGMICQMLAECQHDYYVIPDVVWTGNMYTATAKWTGDMQTPFYLYTNSVHSVIGYMPDDYACVAAETNIERGVKMLMRKHLFAGAQDLTYYMESYPYPESEAFIWELTIPLDEWEDSFRFGREYIEFMIASAGWAGRPCKVFDVKTSFGCTSAHVFPHSPFSLYLGDIAMKCTDGIVTNEVIASGSILAIEFEFTGPSLGYFRVNTGKVWWNRAAQGGEAEAPYMSEITNKVTAWKFGFPSRQIMDEPDRDYLREVRLMPWRAVWSVFSTNDNVVQASWYAQPWDVGEDHQVERWFWLGTERNRPITSFDSLLDGFRSSLMATKSGLDEMWHVTSGYETALEGVLDYVKYYGRDRRPRLDDLVNMHDGEFTLGWDYTIFGESETSPYASAGTLTFVDLKWDGEHIEGHGPVLGVPIEWQQKTYPPDETVYLLAGYWYRWAGMSGFGKPVLPDRGVMGVQSTLMKRKFKFHNLYKPED